MIVNGVTVSNRWSLEHRSRNRYRGVDPVRHRHEEQWKDPHRGIPKVSLEVGMSGVAPECEVSPIGDV